MATGSTKDVKLTLSVETLGEADIKALKQAVLSLAQGGSDAAPEFQKLADQIDRLGEQNEALQSFRALNDQVAELSTKQATAATSATELKTKLDAQATSVEQARQNQAQAKVELDRLSAAYRAAGVEIAAYKAQTDAATKDTQGYRDQLRDLVRAKGEAKEAELQQARALKATNTEVTEAVAAQKKLETAYTSAAKQAATLGTSLTAQQQALEAATRATEELGASATDVAASEARLVSAFNEVGDEARLLKQNLDAASAASKNLADQQAFDRLLADAQKTRDAAEYVRFWEQALREAEDAQRQLQAATAASNWQAEATEIVNAAEATQRLARETEIAAAAARELASQAAFEKAAADSQKLLRAAEYVRFWEQALKEGGTEAQKTAAAAAAAADRIEQAFKTTGVRSVESLNAEIVELRGAMDTLRAQAAATGQSFSGAFTQGEARINALQRELRELNGTLTTSDRLAGLFKNSLGQIAAGNLIADAVGYLVNKVKELGVAFVDTIARSQSLTRALNAIYKDAATTAAQIDFLRSTALNAGVAVSGIQDAFVKFSAATKSANIPLQQSNELFANLVRAGGTLGLSSEQVTGALEALGQMASKGTVSMEELRQQLGDRLPGALSLAAQGLGLTDAELIKLVETGGLAARDLFPALSNALKTMHGEVTGITPAWETFKNILSGVATDAGDAGWATLLEGAIKLLGGTIGSVALAFSTLWEGMRLTGVAALALFETFRGNGKEAWAFLNEEIDKTNLRLEKQQLRLEMLINPTEQVAARLKELNAQQTASGAAAQVAAAGTKELQGVTVATAEGQKALQAALGVTADSYVKATNEIVKQISAAEKQAEAAGKNVKAAQEEGTALEALAQLRGEERAELEAAVRAKELELAAQEKVSAAKQKEADLLMVQKALLIDTANARGLTQQQLDGEVQKLDQKIAKAQAEAAQSKGTLSNLQLEVAARQSAVQTYGDQSDAIDRLKQAMLTAEAAATALHVAQKSGAATMEQVRAADIAAGQARAAYNDALRDSVDKIKAVATVEQAKINVQLAGLGVAQNAYNLLAQSSRASGDYAMAVYYEIEAKRVQIKVTELQAQAKKLEAEAEIKAIEAERQALIATNALTEAKKLELEARTLNAKAKAIEAGASADIIRAMEMEIVAIRNKQNGLDVMGRSLSSSTDLQRQNTSATATSTSAIDANASALDRQAAASERAAAAERKRLNVDKEGFTTDKNGQRMVAGSDIMTRTGMLAFLKQAGVDDEAVAMEIIRRATDAQGNVIYHNNPLQVKHGGTTLSNALLKEAEAYTFGSKQDKRETYSNSKPAGTASTSPTPSTTDNRDVGRSAVTINLNGNVNANNQAEVDRLLNQIAQAAGTAR